ncbi:MAG: hypothetical protein Q7J27_14190 [Syntrophales bacterium]|nr:hypothetical protein [Syntrophales bacterium]
MKTYIFGSDYYKSARIKAVSLEQAIRLFCIQELFPENFVDKSFVKSSEYSSALDRYVKVFKPDTKPAIFIHEGEGGEKKKIGSLFLSQALEPDYQKLVPKQALLDGEHPGEVEETTLPVLGNVTAISTYNKIQLRQKHDQILLKKAEMEQMVRELNVSMSALKKELARKAELIYAFETFLGVHEKVYQLLAGAQAVKDEPLAIYQQVLYMDEEIGAWEDGGIDFKDLDKFDAWIVKNYERYLYREKAICVFQVRRHKKDYGTDAFTDVLLNVENFKTYFLIRNGENLYRIWGEINITQRLFPTKTEYEDIVKDSFSEETNKRELERKHKAYLLGLLYIQGLIERTPILGENLKDVNLLTGDFSEDQIVLIRDDEKNQWITDGRPSWSDLLKQNRSTIGVGTRVVFCRYDWKNYGEYNDANRMYPNVHSSFPEQEKLYQIEEALEKSYCNYDFLIRYNPEDEIWGRDYRGYYESRIRKNRIPFRFYKDEVINFDAITFEECDYYIKNRNERKDYLNILPVLTWIRNLKKEEESLENEFIKLIHGISEMAETNVSEIKDAIKWWKLKNKWKRDLMKDDAKALRMITRALKSGKFKKEGKEENEIHLHRRSFKYPHLSICRSPGYF